MTNTDNPNQAPEEPERQSEQSGAQEPVAPVPPVQQPVPPVQQPAAPAQNTFARPDQNAPQPPVQPSAPQQFGGPQHTGQQPTGQYGQQPTGQYGQQPSQAQPPYGQSQQQQQSGHQQQTGPVNPNQTQPTVAFGAPPQPGQYSQPGQPGQGQPGQYGAPGTPQNTGQYGWNGQPPQPPKEKKRLSKGALTGIIAGGSVLVLLIVGGIVGVGIGNATHAPEVTVKAYLDALKAGKAEQALSMTGAERSDADVLLTDEAYSQATQRVSAYTVGRTRTSGDTATVAVRIKQAGETFEQDFTLTRTGKDAVIFDKWKLNAPELTTLEVDVAAPADAGVTVAGVELKDVEPVTDGVYELRAFPGTYDVALADSKWFSAEESEATALGFGQAAAPALLTATLTDEGTKAADAAVNAYIDGCGAATTLEPDGCPFGIKNDTGYTPSDVKWTFDTRPTFSVGEFSGGSWNVDGETTGRMSMTCTLTNPANGATGPGYSVAPVNFQVRGTITAFDDKGATFVPAPVL
ncbi:hypothetical protein [Plantibacter sp. YIM 135347]|uniref:hypothetical protein n=1 Tax=Plantibacter sp. YIM 135347 TaxID=3423919 RepID=UPI003D346743